MMSEVSSLVALHTTISLSPFPLLRDCREMIKISDFYFKTLFKKLAMMVKIRWVKIIFMHFVLRWLFADNLNSNLFRISICELLNEIHFNLPSIKSDFVRFLCLFYGSKDVWVLVNAFLVGTLEFYFKNFVCDFVIKIYNLIFLYFIWKNLCFYPLKNPILFSWVKISTERFILLAFCFAIFHEFSAFVS